MLNNKGQSMSSLKAKLKASKKTLELPTQRNPVAHSDIMSKGGIHTKDTPRHQHRKARQASKAKLKSGNWF